MALVIKFSNKFQEYLRKYSVTQAELSRFLNAKLADSMAKRKNS